MTIIKDGERLAVLEEKVDSLSKRIGTLDGSIGGLHGKMDTLMLTLSKDYVSKATFEEFKHSRTLDRLLTIIVTAVITGLISYFIQHGVK
jgi:hypothetical protein